MVEFMIISFVIGFIIGALVMFLQNSENEKKMESLMDERIEENNKLLQIIDDLRVENDHLRLQLIESRAREGKGVLERLADNVVDVFEDVGQVINDLLDKFSGMSPDEIRVLADLNDSECDHNCDECEIFCEDSIYWQGDNDEEDE